MKIKIWTGVITLALALVILRSYVSSRQNAVSTGTRPAEEKQTERRIPGGALETGEASETERAAETEEERNVSREETGFIRVLLKNDDFQEMFHEQLEITGTGAFQVQRADMCTVYEAGTKVKLEPEAGGDWNGGKMVFSSVEPDGRLQILSLRRDQAPPAYPGKLELTWQEEGYLVINEVALEEYLPSVLSSEMSASFPEEALKAQAISARTYARKRMEEKNDWGFDADLDDSVSYQVYNNRSSDEITRKAVQDTEGLVLWQNGELADIFYYSTSCGATAGDVFLDEETFARFLEEGRETDLEYEEPWYRWQTAVTEEKIRQNLTAMGLEAPERITGITVLQRQESGRASLLEIGGGDRVLQISGEYDIRRALAPDQEICLGDKSTSQPMALLPSAWFVLEEEAESAKTGGFWEDSEENGTPGKQWRILGGGFGHGNGLSQNGAKWMAASGADCEAILNFYYDDIQIGPWDWRGEG